MYNFRMPVEEIEVTMVSPVSPEAIMACAVIEWRKANRDLLIEDVSELFGKIRERGLPVERVALRRIPGGLYSEDVEAFVGRLLAAGYASARSPIIVHDRGLEICKEIVKEELESSPETFPEVARSLGFDIAWANAPTLQ